MRKLRLLLFPFSVIYFFVTTIRNFLFDLNFLKSKEHDVKIISIGNLSVGGTGKSPITLYLLSLLFENNKIAILSRGYGRSTTGFKIVDSNSTSLEVGDEPLMFKSIGKEHVEVAVCENRNDGILELRQRDKEINLILLDDAFQHRRTKSGLSILLTTFQNPFFNDFVLPMGDLRERRVGASRADIIIVTKSPTELDEIKKKKYLSKLEKYYKPVFFSSIMYDELVPFNQKKNDIKHVLLVSGIANPFEMISYLTQRFQTESILFSDHHEYTKEDIERIHRKFDTFVSSEKAIVTTFKDYMRLKKNIKLWGLDKYPWYFLPISLKLDREEEFTSLIKKYVGKN